jgi:hypothetical protein
MSVRRTVRSWLAPLALVAPLLASAAPARAATNDPVPAAASASAAAASALPPAASAAPEHGHEAKEGAKDAAKDGAKEDQAGKGRTGDTATEADVDRKGEVVEIGLHVSNVTKLDPVKGVFEIEGTLTMHGKKTLPPCKKERIAEMFDGEAKKADLIEEDKAEDGTMWRSCKVAVEIVGDLDVKRYPFDSQTLVIDVVDPEDANDGVEYRAITSKTGDYEPSAVAETFHLPGWDLAGFKAATVKEKAETGKGEISQARFTIDLKRPFFASFVKALLAVIFQLLVTLIAILVPVKNITNRITMVTGALLAIAATHNTVSSGLGAPYLTTADKFYLACYFSLLVNVFLSALMLRADNEGQADRAKGLYKLAFIIVPVVTILSIVVAMLPIG